MGKGRGGTGKGRGGTGKGRGLHPEKKTKVGAYVEDNAVYEKKNDEFWRNEITANKGNTKKLWRTM